MYICERGLNTEKLNGMKTFISYMKLEQHHVLAINNFNINVFINKTPVIHDYP
jgi:hypothetical protein